MLDYPSGSPGQRWWYLLLVIPVIAVLWIPFYGSVNQPQLAGIPFFYWYMFLWVLLDAALTALVYWMTRSPAAEQARAPWPEPMDVAENAGEGKP